MAKEQQEYLQRSKKFPVMVCLPLCVRAPITPGKKRQKQKQRVIMMRMMRMMRMMVALTSMSMKSQRVISHICIFAGQEVFFWE